MGLVQVGLRLDSGLLDRVDVVRGDVPRAVWLRRAVEQALAVDDVAEVTGVPIRSTSASLVEPRPAPAEQAGSKFLPEEWAAPVEEQRSAADRFFADPEVQAIGRSGIPRSGQAKRGVGPVPKRKG